MTDAAWTTAYLRHLTVERGLVAQHDHLVPA